MDLTPLHITPADRAAFAGRSNAVDYSVTEQLHYLGNYVRDIPSNLTRMMENAHDWEHLPFIHPSSFAAIAPVETGTWGWRCKTALPNNGGEQLVELLVDDAGQYWATTVVGGPGQGTQIHTQASACGDGGITVDVRFYAPEPPVSQEQGNLILAYLQAQYATLYDEDEDLMVGRQDALDERKVKRSEAVKDNLNLGPEANLNRAVIHSVDLGTETALVRFVEGQWIAHAARCPHALAPLEHGTLDHSNHLACPWHGYRFDLASGEEAQKRCGKLALYKCSVNVAGELEVAR